MIDDSNVIRGACGSCECAEFVLGKIKTKCDDCECPASKHREQENVNNVSMKGISKFVRGRVTAFFVWGLISSVVAALGYSSKAKQFRFDREFAPQVYQIGIFTFFWVTVFSFFSYLGSNNSSKAAVTKSTTILNFMVMSVYVFDYLELNPYLRDELGYPVDLCRYVAWFFNMEALSCIIGFVSQVESSMVERAVLNSWLLTIFGFIGSITKGSVSQWILLLSYGTHSISVQVIWDMYKKAITGENDCPVNDSMMELSQTITAYSWHAFALVHALLRFEFITFAQGEFLYFLSHVFAKIPLTLIFNTAPIGIPAQKEDSRRAENRSLET